MRPRVTQERRLAQKYDAGFRVKGFDDAFSGNGDWKISGNLP